MERLKEKCNKRKNRSLPLPGPLSGGVFGPVSAHNGARPVGVVSAEGTQDAPWIPQKLGGELPPAAWALGLSSQSPAQIGRASCRERV